MKIKEGYLLREIAGSTVVVPVGRADFSGMITLNGTAALLWSRLSEGATEEELCAAMLAEYDVSEERAAADVSAFVQSLRAAELLDE